MGGGWGGRETDSAQTDTFVYHRQVPEAVEELCETAPPSGQQPQGQAD